MLQICNGTESKWNNFNHFLFSFLSPLSSLYPFLFSLTSVLSHRFPLFSATPIPSALSFPFNLRSVWRWPLSLETQARRATSSPLIAHEPSSSLTDLVDLSLPLSLFWWLVVLIVVGWLRFVDRCWCGLRCGFWVGVDVGFGSALWVWDLGWVKVDEGCYGWSRSVKVAVGVCLMKW